MIKKRGDNQANVVHFHRMHKLFSSEKSLIETGFYDFDKKINGGFLGGQLITLASRSSMGKSILALNFAENISEHMPCAIFSFEMTKFQVMDRLVGKLTGIDQRTLLTGKFNNEEQLKLSNALSFLRNKQLFIFDNARIKIESLIEDIEFFHKMHGKTLFIVDCLQLVTSKKYENDRIAEISYITHLLARAAHGFSSSILLLSQLNRGPDYRKDKRPCVDDLCDISEDLYADSDLVISLYREEVDDKSNEKIKGIAELCVLKSRQGEAGIVRLIFSGERLSFSRLTLDG